MNINWKQSRMREIQVALLTVALFGNSFVSVHATTFTPSGSTIASTIFQTDLAKQIDDRVTGYSSAGTALDEWTTRGSNTLSWVRNSTAWTSNGTSSINLTGISPWNSAGGYCRAGTLISPRHFLMAKHFTIPVGSTMVFVDANNNIVTRTVQSEYDIPNRSIPVYGQTVNNLDITVGLLDSDVPGTITHYPLITDEQLTSYVSATSGLPVLVLNQQDKLIVHDWKGNATTWAGGLLFNHSQSSNAQRNKFYVALTGCDSGDVGGFFAGGQFLPIFLNYGTESGTNLSKYIPEINAAMTVLGGGYQVSTVDLSSYLPPNSAPTITSTSTFSVDENSATSTLIGTVTATDPDVGQTLTYSIVSGNSNGAFALSSTTGALTVASRSGFDFETSSSTSLVIKVADSYTTSASTTQTLTINVNDINESPTLTAPATITKTYQVLTNGLELGSLDATDPDTVQTLSYSIVSGNTENAFAINASTGVLTVADVGQIAASSTYTLRLAVTDSGASPLSSQATTTINIENRPFISSVLSLSIDENTSTSSPLATFVGAKPYSTSTLVYTISGSDAASFVENSSSGALYAASSTVFDFETKSSYTFILRVQDQVTSNYGTSIVTMSVLNINEAPIFTSTSTSAHIDEGAQQGTVIDTFTATDLDAGQTVTYSITGGNESGAFSLDTSNGVLTVASSTLLNYETVASYPLTIMAKDNGAPQAETAYVYTVYLNDVNETPVLITPSAVGYAYRSLTNGSTVATVSSSDLDLGQTISYSIISGNTDNIFAIDASTGAITISDISAIAGGGLYTLTVRATDNGSPVLYKDELIIINIRASASITSIPATDVGQTSATLNGFITTEGGGTPISRGFEYGQTTAYGATTTITDAFSIGSSTKAVTGLSCATTYHYRAFLTTSDGVFVDDDASFTTSACTVSSGASGGGSSGGGGGGGGSPGVIYYNRATSTTSVLGTVLPSPRTNILPVGTPKAITLKDITAGSSGKDVKTLQQILNTLGFTIAKSGAGSPGKETTAFGSLTKQALIKFQKAYGITPAQGYFGPKTKAVMKGLGF